MGPAAVPAGAVLAIPAIRLTGLYPALGAAGPGVFPPLDEVSVR
ncbi:MULTISPECIES: hypothetical protein [unclassified Frankia]